MNPFLSAWLASRLIDRRHAHRRQVLDAFECKRREDFYERAFWDEIRNDRLALLLAHARDHVPFYKEHIKSELRITAQNAMEILNTLPRVSRSMIQADIQRFVADTATFAIEDATGGSTGTPMIFKVDRDTQIARESSLMWADGLAGWNYGERIAMLWGSDKDVTNASRRARLAFRWWVDNRRWYNAFDMGPDKMRRFHERLQKFEPHILVAYAGSLVDFARFLKNEGLKPSYPIKTLISSAEVLSPSMRDAIEEVFGKPVYDRYGNREMGAIAAECYMHEGLHVNESDTILEIDSNRPHQNPGPIHVTYLRNFAMPLIRYNTEDLGVFLPTKACACGRKTMKLAFIAGRQSDTLETSSGKLIHGEFITHLLYASQHVRSFQFVQEASDRYRLVVVAETKNDEEERRWRKEILEAVGRNAELVIEYVSAIPLLPSGKHKFTISKIKK